MRLSTLASAATLIVACCLVPALAGPSTDRVTGLPIVPGATLVETQAPQTMCGITVRGVQYESDGSAAKAVDFYRKALPGAASWTSSAARMTEFLMPNGRASVRVLDTPNGFYIVYGAFSKPITPAQDRRGLKC